MERESDLFKTILVPVDFSPCSDEAFRVACQIARLCKARLLVLHVIDTSAVAACTRLGLPAVSSDAALQRRRVDHHAWLKIRQLLEMNEAANIKATWLIVEGTPCIEIATVARTEKLDLVVMGRYGSTAEKVAHAVSCSILTVPLARSASQRRTLCGQTEGGEYENWKKSGAVEEVGNDWHSSGPGLDVWYGASGTIRTGSRCDDQRLSVCGEARDVAFGISHGH